MFERFTRELRGVIILAHNMARAAGLSAITPDHLLVGLLDVADGKFEDPKLEHLGRAVLDRLGVDRAALRAAVLANRPSGPLALAPDDAELLRTLGIDADEISRRLEEEFPLEVLQPATAAPTPTKGRITFTAATKEAIEGSLRIAKQGGHHTIDGGHLLLALLTVNPTGRLLTEHGVTVFDARVAIQGEHRTRRQAS